MKSKLRLILVLLVSTALWLQGQGTFIFDQQSSDESNVLPGGVAINPAAMPGQSFTPSLSVVGFIRLYLTDTDLQAGVGGAFYVNLRSNSISGTILSSSAVVSLGNAYSGPVNFLLTNTVPVSAGTTYYFDVVRQSGLTWDANISFYSYVGGTAYLLGAPDPQGDDLWFREGAVPEPASGSLLLLGLTALALRRRRRA